MPFPFFLRRREDARQAMHPLVFRQLHASCLQSNRSPLVQTSLQGPVNCSGSVGIAQENEHPESWWSCWLPPWCPLPSSPQGVLSTLLIKEPNSKVKAACPSLLLLGVLKASPPTFAP